MFDYEPLADTRVIELQPQDNLTARLVVYQTPIPRVAEIVRPANERPCAAILYVHWLESEACDSNRTQFEQEAREMAKRGAVCMMVETMWSDMDWFYKRTQADDRANSIQQVKELRMALDILLAEPNVDPERVAYVGHDFGAMYGIVMGSVDKRPQSYVLMAGTPRFPDWYLYYPRLSGDARDAFIEEMRELDPITHVAELAPAPLFFQFATDDFHVPKERATEFYEQAQGPKQIGWYEAGHGLNAAATAARTAWLAEQLQLAPQPAAK